MGGFESVSKPWGMHGLPKDFAFSLLPEDWEHFRVLMEQAIVRIPALETAPVRRHVNGPESFTPDNRYMLGEAPELRNFFVAAGFNSVGIASAAGAGKALAEWIVGGEPSMDLWDVDVRRFMPFQGNAAYLRERTTEVVGLLYAMHWPFRQPATARGVRRSAVHDRLAARGAVFGVVAGWERANWFATDGVEPRYVYTYGRQNWFPCAGAEHRAVREAVGLFDQSSLAKFRVQGPDATAVLQRLCANDVDVAPGRIVYTQMLNARGGIECDLTVSRLGEDAYLIVTIAAAATHDADWIRRGIGAARAIMRWTRCGWRRATAPGATTSAARTHRSRPGWASPSPSRRMGSSGARCCCASATSRSRAASSCSRSPTPSRCCSATSRSTATASSWGGSPPAPTVTRSAARWAWGTSRTRTAWTPGSS